VILADIQDDLGGKLVEEITQSGGSAEYFHLDVTEESNWEKLMEYLKSKFGKLDVLVNNAGISASSPDLLNIEIFDNVMKVNTRGVFLGMKYCLGLMSDNGAGSIVNISSISGLVGQAYVHMGYSGSKGAVRLMTKSAAIQYAEKGIRVNSVHPGVMPPMTTSEMTAAAITDLRSSTFIVGCSPPAPPTRRVPFPVTTPLSTINRILLVSESKSKAKSSLNGVATATIGPHNQSFILVSPKGIGTSH
jgi:NAD(P)-dependent dehydrogenase (short-subunit alcohol dehydrogenase family)